jgi:hypothetical protein
LPTGRTPTSPAELFATEIAFLSPRVFPMGMAGDMHRHSTPRN